MTNENTVKVHTFVSKNVQRLTSERTKFIIVAENRCASRFLGTGSSA